MVEYNKCFSEDVIDREFWTSKPNEISKIYFHVDFRQVVEVPAYSQESRTQPKSDIVTSMDGVISEPENPIEKSIEEVKAAPESDQFEEKYNCLYAKYVNIKKEREELRQKLEETEIRKDLTQKKDNATKGIIPNEGYGLKEVSMIAGVFLLIGMIIPTIIRLLLT